MKISNDFIDILDETWSIQEERDILKRLWQEQDES